MELAVSAPTARAVATRADLRLIVRMIWAFLSWGAIVRPCGFVAMIGEKVYATRDWRRFAVHERKMAGSRHGDSEHVGLVSGDRRSVFATEMRWIGYIDCGESRPAASVD